jgi:hypothetical protein
MKLNLTDSTDNATSLRQCGINAINPSVGLTVYFNGPTANYSGVTYNGTTQFSKISYNPGIDSSLALDNTTLMGYVYTTGNYLSWGQRSGGTDNIGLLLTNTNNVQNFINDNATIQNIGTSNNSSGFSAASRNGTTNTKYIIKNGTTLTEIGTIPTGRADLNLVEGARTTNGTNPDAYYNMRAQFVALGTGFNTTELAVVDNLVNNLQGSVDSLFGLTGASARQRY